MHDQGYHGYHGDGIVPDPSAPPPTPAWSVSGTLATPDALGNTPTLEVGLQQTFAEPGTYTIEFDVVSMPPALSPSAAAEATIQWTVKGNLITRKVTIASGVSISGTGEAIRIVIVDASDNNVGTASYEYKVTALVTKGVRPTNPGYPILVEPVLESSFFVTQGTDITLDIPQGVGVNTIHVVPGQFLVGGGAVVSDLTYKDLKVTQIDNTTAAVGQFMPVNRPYMPLIPGATQLVLSCTRAASQVQVTVFFGVDG